MNLIQRFDMQIGHIEELQTKLLSHHALIELEEWITKTFQTVSLEFDHQSMNINLSGTKADLETLWSELRERGWYFPKYSRRPKANDSSWGGFFRKETDENAEDPELLFIHFSSTVCRRVKVGTKTVVEDVYHTVCGDETDPGIPQSPASTELVLPPGVGVHSEGGFQNEQGHEVDIPALMEAGAIITAPAGTPGTPGAAEPFDDDIPF